MPINVDEGLLKKIEECVALGCSTSKEIADSIGIKKSTYDNLREGKRKNGKIEKAKIGEAIKKGNDRQPLNMLPILELSLMRSAVEHRVEENDKERVIPANAALLIFALDNLSRRADPSYNRRWINKQHQVDKKEDDRAKMPSEITPEEREARKMQLREMIGKGNA